jgi:hypothetical protein
MRNAFLEIRVLAYQPDKSRHPGGVLDEIGMIADACHNLPGTVSRRLRSVSGPDPFVYLWHTASPEQRRWLASQFRYLGLDHAWLAEAPWPPKPQPPSTRPRLGRGGMRIPRTAREFAAVGTERLRRLVLEGAALEPPGRKTPDNMLAHLDHVGPHLIRLSRPGEVQFLPPGPGDLQQYRCLLRMMDGATIVGHVRLRASSFAALRPNIPLLEGVLLAASVPQSNERDVYLWTRDHRAADPQCSLCAARSGHAEPPAPDGQ